MHVVIDTCHRAQSSKMQTCPVDAWCAKHSSYQCLAAILAVTSRSCGLSAGVQPQADTRTSHHASQTATLSDESHSRCSSCVPYEEGVCWFAVNRSECRTRQVDRNHLGAFDWQWQIMMHSTVTAAALAAVLVVCATLPLAAAQAFASAGAGGALVGAPACDRYRCCNCENLC